MSIFAWSLLVILYLGWAYRRLMKITHKVTVSDDSSVFLLVLSWWAILGAHLLWPFDALDKLIRKLVAQRNPNE